jgi:hypothetical protein
MTIHQIQNEGGSSLGPVEVTKAYEMKADDKSCFVLIKDGSGTAALKIWGIPPSQCPKVGDRIKLFASGAKASIVNKEWPAGSGKYTLNASGCSLETDVASNGSSPQGGYSSPHRNQTPPTSGSYGGVDKLGATMKRVAESTKLYVDNLVEAGFSKEEAIMLAQGSSGVYPLWWFGEKGLS